MESLVRGLFRGFFVLFLTLAGCEKKGSGRAETEIWRIDFQTHQVEVQTTFDEMRFDLGFVRERTLHHLRSYYEGLPIFFEDGPPASGRSSICVPHGPSNLFGRALYDRGNNDMENNCHGSGSDDRGVFIDSILARTHLILEQGGIDPIEKEDQLAKWLAMILAHEIGHGLGLDHNEGTGSNIMRSQPIFGTQIDYGFTPENWALLLENLSPQ